MNGKDCAILTTLTIIGAISTLLVMITHEISALFGLCLCIISIVVYLGYMEIRQVREDRERFGDGK